MSKRNDAFMLRAECCRCKKVEFYPKTPEGFKKLTTEAALIKEMYKDGWIVKPISKFFAQYTCKDCRERVLWCKTEDK